MISYKIQTEALSEGEAENWESSLDARGTWLTKGDLQALLNVNRAEGEMGQKKERIEGGGQRSHQIRGSARARRA